MSTPKSYTMHEWSMDAKYEPVRVTVTIRERDDLRVALDKAQQEITALRVKVKFLREKAGIFNDEIEAALDAGHHPDDLKRLEEQTQTLINMRLIVEGLAQEFESVVQEVERPKGGMSVTPTGDFMAARQIPSVVAQFGRWARALRESLSGAPVFGVVPVGTNVAAKLTELEKDRDLAVFQKYAGQARLDMFVRFAQRVRETLTKLRNDPKQWVKPKGPQGADQYQGMPPGMRLVDAVLQDDLYRKGNVP